MSRDDKQGLTFWRGLPYSWQGSPRCPKAVSGDLRLFFCAASSLKKTQKFYGYFIYESLQNQREHSAHYALSFQQGEEKGFAWFFRSLYPALSFYAFKITGDKEAGEEIASNAFITIWERHERFADALSIRKYLYRVVRNGALKHLRKEKQTTAASKEVIYLYGHEHEKDCFSSLVAAEVSRELLQAIEALPPECSKVFRLLYIEGKSIKETAEALHLSPSTVKTQKKRGLEALRKSLRISTVVLAIGTHLLTLPFLQ